jgi:hemoglobin-like flavoprotein
MTPEQLTLVRSSYAALGPSPTSMAEDFYSRLFAIDPSTRALFSYGPEVMAVKFVAELDAIVDAISRYDDFRARVDDLGARHAAYGVETRHYEAVGEALVGALAAHLADAWDARIEAAWRRAYNLVAEVMMSAQQAVSRRPARE